MAAWFNKAFLHPTIKNQQWKGSGIDVLPDICGEISIQVKNRGQTKTRMCSKQATEI